MATQEQNGSASATVQQRASGAYSYAQRSIDRVIPPESRHQAYDAVAAFAADRPVLFSFITTQLALSFLPLLLFIAFALSTVAFSLAAAVIFSLFWIGVAFMLLIPTLLVTSSIAVLVWGWAVGSFLIARWLYRHSPVAVQGDLGVDVAGKHLEVVKDERGIDGNVTKESQ